MINNMKSLLLSLALALPVFWVAGVVQAEATDVALTREAQAAITPARALEMLKQGNERFVNGKTLPRDLLAQVRQTATGQYPFAAIVSCLDSRIPPAIVFDQGIGDLFVGRMAVTLSMTTCSAVLNLRPNCRAPNWLLFSGTPNVEP